MRTRVIFAIALAIVVGIGAYAVTGYFAHGTHGHQGMLPTDSIAAKLELTAQQRSTIEAISAEFQRKHKKMHRAHREHRGELLDLLRERPPDRERIERKLQEISNAQAEMQRLAVDHLLDVSGELNEQQKEKLFELIDEAMCPGAVMGGGRDCG